MTRWILALLLAAQVPHPAELPPGQFCAHASQREPNPAHPCACQRECVPSEDENGNQTVVVKEDVQCKQWCFAAHCHCPVRNCP